MKREISLTSDGSSTIYLPEWNEYYHSKHGAIKEAEYVYIEKGLAFFVSENQLNEINVLEIGFGTGLNAFLTYLYAKMNNLTVNYTAIEAFPVDYIEAEQLKYPEVLHRVDESTVFEELHNCEWENYQAISPHFNLKKVNKDFLEFNSINEFHVVYFDAFGPRVQPELWTTQIFDIMYSTMKNKGVLTTYCAQGDARRAMIKSGFEIEKLTGPPGKRHMLRTLKL